MFVRESTRIYANGFELIRGLFFLMSKSKDMGNPWPAGVSKPAQRALAGAGYTRLEHLANARESDLLKLHGMGPKAMGALKQALAEKGLTLKQA